MQRQLPGRKAKLAETHLSIIFGNGHEVTKIKKPVLTDFVDLRDRERRRYICEREVALNRRLARDVYLGVVDVDGEPAVAMRQLPRSARLSWRLEHGSRPEPDLKAIARTLAAFHARAERTSQIDKSATAGAVLQLWEENLAAIQTYAPLRDLDRVRRIREHATRFITFRAGLFAERIRDGRVCDGHGDLLADDIYCFDDGPRILDCLEFDDRLRWGDVLSDIAFLAMDLESRGHPEAAEIFVREYRRLTADNAPAALLDHYVAYRALVRAKVAYIRQRQNWRQGADEASNLLVLCERHLHSAMPKLILIGGAPGTGKSTVAAAISDALKIVYLSTDEARHDVLRIPHNVHSYAGYEKGAYTPAAVAATYREVLTRARLLLEHGYSVLAEGTWRSEQSRAAAREVAALTGSNLVEIECETSQPERARRIRSRRPVTTLSDVTPAVAARLERDFDPWPHAFHLNAEGDKDVIAGRAIELLGHVGPWS